MSEQVTVKSFGEGSPWEHGITYYPVTFDRNGQDFACTWGKKGDPPAAGEQVEGEFFQQNGEWRFRKASKPQGGGASTGSSGSQDYPRRNGGGKSPDQQASIVRQHSQQVALEFLSLDDGRIAYEEKDLDNPQFLERVVKPVIDWFEADANKAASGAGAVTSREPTPAPPQATHAELHGLLEKAGLNTNAARVVTDYALSHMSAEEQDAALEMLGNENRAEAALRRLSEKAETHFGSPLPTASPDDDLPF